MGAAEAVARVVRRAPQQRRHGAADGQASHPVRRAGPARIGRPRHWVAPRVVVGRVQLDTLHGRRRVQPEHEARVPRAAAEVAVIPLGA
eukprot:720479-Prymnesium_polylepis.1